MLADGVPVTHAAVARAAGVSAWLTYQAPEIREAVQRARDQQARDGLLDPPSRVVGVRASSASLQTDLLAARAEIKQLREEKRRLRARLEKQLGAEVESASAAELLERVQQVEEANRNLNRDLSERESRLSDQAERIAELEDENEAKTEALRAMMFAQNT